MPLLDGNLFKIFNIMPLSSPSHCRQHEIAADKYQEYTGYIYRTQKNIDVWNDNLTSYHRTVCSTEANLYKALPHNIKTLKHYIITS
jgi:hypothetical protein